MTPAARIQAAIEIVGGLENTAQPADRFLSDWFAARRYAGSKDRAAIAARVYDVLRHRASYSWRMGSGEARALAIASLQAEKKSPDEIEALFAAGAYGPPPLTDAERATMGSPTHDAPPNHIEGEYPVWLEPELIRAFGENLLPEMQAMQARAPVDLRVNTLRAERNGILVGLASLGLKARPTPYSPDGVRLDSAEGLGALHHTSFFQTGAFEFQDESSQIVSLLCGAEPGMSVLDLAAGAGGKSLALAATMQNRGEILAFDDYPERLKALNPRARRAGASIIKVAKSRGGPFWGDGKFDIVLVDAPCSGSGTWRRSPELKWRLTAERLATLTAAQASLIDDGARHTVSGGRLVYATCSILPAENGDQIDNFLARNSEFRVLDAQSIWRARGLVEPPGLGRYFVASPLTTGTDGFFACVMTRN